MPKKEPLLIAWRDRVVHRDINAVYGQAMTSRFTLCGEWVSAGDWYTAPPDTVATCLLCIGVIDG